MIYNCSIIFYIFIFFLFPKQEIECLNCSDQNTFSVLVITETKGYIHRPAIKAGIELIKIIGIDNNFNVFHSANSNVITVGNLKNINTIIFLNTTSDILNVTEQKIMEEFISKGRGFVGVHSAADTEYKWSWYGELVGAYFESHPQEHHLQL